MHTEFVNPRRVALTPVAGLLAGLLIGALGNHALAQTGNAQTGNEHWVATWSTAQVPPLPVRLGSVGIATTPAQQALAGFNNQTIRMIVPVSIGGRRVRVQLSNAYNTAPLQVGAAHVGIREKESSIVPGSDRALSFNGKPGFMIPPGAVVLSDAVDLDVPQLSELAVSIYLPGTTGAPTIHPTGLHNTYISKQGDATGRTAIDDAAVTQSWYWLAAVDVVAPAETGVVVAFGDSITDGTRSTVGANSSWPSLFAKRLLANSATSNLAIVNQAIAGNRVLRDTQGINALARFDGDVLGQAGVKWLVMLEGINDIGRATGNGANPNDAVVADDVIAGLRQLVDRAHVHGIKVVGATILPYTGAAYYSDAGEQIRQTVNRWIRTSGTYDAVVDFEAATRDPNNPKAIRPDFDSGDHLHPNDAGYKAMADAIDLSIFGRQPVTSSAARTR